MVSWRKTKSFLFICLFVFLSGSGKVKMLVTQSCPTLCDPFTVAYQAPLSVGFSRQEYWSGLPSPSLGGVFLIEPRSSALQADFLLSEPPRKPQKRE